MFFMDKLNIVEYIYEYTQDRHIHTHIHIPFPGLIQGQRNIFYILNVCILHNF